MPGESDGWRRQTAHTVPAHTHTLLRVDLDEGVYLADVGFGGHLLAGPIRLERDVEQTTPASVVRLIGIGETYMLQALLPKGWQDMYLFTLEPQHAIDYEVANWFTSTNPGSRFHASLLAEHLTPQRRISLFNKKVTERRPGSVQSERMLTKPGELAEVFDKDFGVTLPVDPAEVWDRLAPPSSHPRDGSIQAGELGPMNST